MAVRREYRDGVVAANVGMRVCVYSWTVADISEKLSVFVNSALSRGKLVLDLGFGIGETKLN